MNLPKGTIVFTTVGRQSYGFDVYAVKLPSDISTLSNSDEVRLTDGISLNFNAQFADDNLSVVYISERSCFPAIYLSKPGEEPQQLPTPPESLFHDRPIFKNNRVYYISAHEKQDKLVKSWNALYATDLNDGKITRLTPYGVVDYSPAISRSGKFFAVASYGSRIWDVKFQDLTTDIVVFEEAHPEKRVVVCELGGWPSWSGDSTVYFHRKAEDGFWSIFQVKLPENLDDLSQFPCTPVRITPPGVNCLTPAAMHDGKRIVVATRRPGSVYRHIEIFDLDSNTFHPVSLPVNPNFQHFNPFVSDDSSFIGYHRFRGEEASGETTIPNLEPVKSPVENISLLRLHGSFASFSPDGNYIAFNAGLSQGLHIVTSDGSKRWTLLPRSRTAFYTSWSPTENNVIYTTLGPVFAPVDRTVQIARVSFDLSHLTPDRTEIPCDVKMLTREESGNNAFPACSLDGKSIVFRSGRNGHKNLYIMDAVEGEFNGSIRQITEGACSDTMPCWSPKGDLIAFTSNRHKPDHSNPFSMYLVKPDGSDLKRVHLEGSELLSDSEREWMERTTHPGFTDNGEWLLFASNLGGLSAEPVAVPRQIQPYGDVFMCRLDGSELTRLTWNGYENGTPAWHPGNELLRRAGERLMGPEKRVLQLRSANKPQLQSRMIMLAANVGASDIHDADEILDEEKRTGEFNDLTWLNVTE
ncbi:uncharacterized protein LOC126687050 [Mercurialis annua]|uniref:uncharacterized protein LOC126687050 n=1 Tax=Mercurialis annua TaxID=3986 RepID=UPI00215E13BC|nr:uncharacterized protein LOC126687050 [Mercurialis annua]